MKKARSLYYRPSLFQSDNTNLELFKDETGEITAEDAFLEMKRTDALIREFPPFVKNAFGVAIP